MNAQDNAAFAVGLREAVHRLDELPAIPIIAQKLLSLDLDTDAGEQEMLKLILQDPTISAKIIGLANSPLVGSTRKVATVNDAALLLGMRRLKSVAISCAIIAKIETPNGRLDLTDLWAHSWEVAFAMLAIVHAMPPRLRPQDGETFLSGMLHDIGYLVLAYLDSERSERLFAALDKETDRTPQDIERDIVGITHDELGAELAVYWQLPAEVINAIRFHHSPYNQSNARLLDFTSKTGALPFIVNLAERLLPTFGASSRSDLPISPEEWSELGITPEQSERVKALALEQAEQASQVIGSLYSG
jgi:putative nucleotidyltransferase with HDIG domain